MMPKRNTAGRRFAALLAAVTAVGWLACTTARADAPAMDDTHAQLGHQWVEQWVQAGKAPRAKVLLPDVPIRGLAAARVTLRVHGIELGHGEAEAEGLEAALAGDGLDRLEVNLADVVHDAATEAFTAVEQSLRSAQMRAALNPRIAAPPKEMSIADIAGRLTVDLQLAHTYEPVRVAADAPVGDVLHRWAPGYHGLRVTRPDAAGEGQQTATVWPATALARNTTRFSQAGQLMLKLGLTPADVAKLARPGGPTLQRFQVIHRVRPEPTQSAVTLVRGNVPLAAAEIDTATLDGMARRMADHLARRYTPKGPLTGTYHPSTGEFNPLVATAGDAALASYALARHTRRLSREEREPNAVQVAASLGKAESLARQMLDFVPDADRPPAEQLAEEQAAVATTALTLLALVEQTSPRADRGLRDRLAAHLLALEHEGKVYTLPDGKGAEAPRPVQGVAAAALAAWFEATRNADAGQATARLIDGLWADLGGTVDIATLPWLALALDHAGPLLTGNADAEAVLRERLLALADLADEVTDKKQIIVPPAIGPPDVIGGFDLYPHPPNTPPNPDWHSTKLLMFLAVVMRQETDDARSRVGYVLTTQLSARFVAQLMMNEPQCYYVRAPEMAIGGVRLALHDNRITINSTAVALLAVTELLESAQALGQSPATAIPGDEPVAP